MNVSGQIILVGIAAGLASALLAGSVLTQTSLSIVLFMFAALPIMAVGLTYGATASTLAAIVCTLAVAAGAQPITGMVVGLAIAAPAAYAAYLMGLARPAEEIGGDEGDMVWFPISDMLLRTGLIVAVGFVLIGLVIGYDSDVATRSAQEFQTQFAEMNPTFQPTDDFVPSLAAFIFRVVPLVQPAVMVMALVGNLYIALRLWGASGKIARPADDWPTALRMPKISMPIFAGAILLSFSGGPLGLVAMVFCGALGTGFVMAGLAMVHAQTRGKSGRSMILALAYIGLLLFLPLVILFLFIGLFDTSRAAPVTRGTPKI